MITTNEPKKTSVVNEPPKPPLAPATPTAAAHPAHHEPLPNEPHYSAGMFWFVLFAFIFFTVVIGYGIYDRVLAEKNLTHETEKSAVPFVNVIHPKSGSAGEQIDLPGDTQAFTDTPIYARTNGYLKKWYFDIGAHVKAGDLLAEIEEPELDQQLYQAQADLKNAQANLAISQITNQRFQDLIKSNSVSQQETDQAKSDLASKQALVTSSEANLHRLQDLQGFEKVYAPFAGIVTARNTDIGDIVQSGNSGTGIKEMFHLTAIDTLRVFVAVPEVYAPRLHTGDKVAVTLDSYPGKTFEGTIVRNSNSINPQSRTLNVEVDVANPKDELLPGAYAFVHLTVPANQGSVTIPANTLLFRSEGLRVGVVRDGHVVLAPITIGHDYGTSLEVVSGLNPEDDVIVDPSDSLTEGAAVQVQETAKKP